MGGGIVSRPRRQHNIATRPALKFLFHPSTSYKLVEPTISPSPRPNRLASAPIQGRRRTVQGSLHFSRRRRHSRPKCHHQRHHAELSPARFGHPCPSHILPCSSKGSARFHWHSFQVSSTKLGMAVSHGHKTTIPVFITLLLPAYLNQAMPHIPSRDTLGSRKGAGPSRKGVTPVSITRLTI